MTNLLQTAAAARNPAPRLPDHAALMMAAGMIERKYFVAAGMAKIVAELVAASVVRP